MTKKSHPNAELVPEGDRPCPICGQTMQSIAERGITVDGCEQHGLWLDRGEIEKIVAKTKRLDDRLSKLKEQKAKTQGKIHGSLFGVLSLLWD